MKKRVISAVVMAAILIPILYFGGIYFKIGVSILAILTFRELLHAKDVKIPKVMEYLAYIILLYLIFATSSFIPSMFRFSYKMLGILTFLILMPSIFFKKQKYKTSEALYLCGILIFLSVVFNLFISLFDKSLLEFIYIIIVSCTTDIFALFGGLLIGKHKLTKISPNKTIEGAVCGIVFSTIIATTYYVIAIEEISIFLIAGLTIILSIVGQIGDLFFSLIKRENDIKDFSNLIPGHGGILDRIDSIIFILIVYSFIIGLIGG